MKKIFALLALFVLKTEQSDHHDAHDFELPDHDLSNDHNHGDHHDHDHEYDENEETAELSHEELLELFQSYDANGDKKLSRGEIISGASAEEDDESIVDYVKRTLDPVIAKHDDEGDGLDIEEFLKMAAETIGNDL